MAASKARAGGQILELTERDLPIGIVGGTILLSLLPIAGLLWWFTAGGPIAADRGADHRRAPWSTCW